MKMYESDKIRDKKALVAERNRRYESQYGCPYDKAKLSAARRPKEDKKTERAIDDTKDGVRVRKTTTEETTEKKNKMKRPAAKKMMKRPAAVVEETMTKRKKRAPSPAATTRAWEADDETQEGQGADVTDADAGAEDPESEGSDARSTWQTLWI